MNVEQQMINVTPTKQKLVTKGQTSLPPGILFSNKELTKIRGKGNVT